MSFEDSSQLRAQLQVALRLRDAYKTACDEKLDEIDRLKAQLAEYRVFAETVWKDTATAGSDYGMPHLADAARKLLDKEVL